MELGTGLEPGTFVSTGHYSAIELLVNGASGKSRTYGADCSTPALQAGQTLYLDTLANDGYKLTSCS